jgi:thiamine pyrophosphate-dependent acetolactate synthase large subunit-like protein
MVEQIMNTLALAIAAAQADLIRVREAKHPLYETFTSEAIRRLVAIDRYEGRVRGRWHSAIRAFGEAKVALLEMKAQANLSKRTQAAPGLCENEANRSQVLPKRTQAEPARCQNEAKRVQVLAKRTQPDAVLFAKTNASNCRWAGKFVRLALPRGHGVAPNCPRGPPVQARRPFPVAG